MPPLMLYLPSIAMKSRDIWPVKILVLGGVEKLRSLLLILAQEIIIYLMMIPDST